MKLRLHQKVLLSVGVVGTVGALAGAGTFATFSAQTGNPTIFASGTLVLSNTISGSTCLSTGGGNTDVNSNDSCAQAFNLSVQAPGDTDTTDITLQNVGSLPASALKIFSDECEDTDAADEDYHGTGLPCSKIQFYIQQYSDSGRTQPSACLFGGETVADTCDFSDTSMTLTKFVTDHSDLEDAISIAGLEEAGGDDTAWFTVGVLLPEDADNTYQGRAASFTLHWHLEQ